MLTSIVNFRLELISSNEEYEFIRTNFDIRINAATVALVNLNFIHASELDENELMDSLATQFHYQASFNAEDFHQCIVKVEPREYVKTDYVGFLGLLFAWHHVGDMVTYYIFKIFQ